MIKQSYLLFKRAVKENKKPILNNLGLAVLFELLSITGLYFLNKIYGELYQAIQVIDVNGIWTSIGTFTIIAMVLVFINGYMMFFINRLAFQIRVGLTTFELFNQFDTAAIQLPNYNQRVQEDLRKFSESSCDLWFAILKAGLHLPIFLGVIISLTEWYIGAAVFLATVGGTYLTRIVARKLIGEQAIQENNEAEFRKSLGLVEFGIIKEQFLILNHYFKRLAFTQAGLGQLFTLLPFILLMPFYISKAITMGAFFQSVNALAKVIDSLTVLIDSRQVIVNVETCLVRLKPLI